jgi:hypothetical protein
MHRERRPRSTRRAFAVKVTLALVIGAVGAVAPLPTTRVERAMATETRSPVADGARVQPAPTTPPVVAEPPDTTAPPTDITVPGPTGAPTTVPEDASTTVPGDGTDVTTPSTTTPLPSTTTTAPPDPNAPPPVRVRITEDTRDFDLIGVTLPVPPEVPVLVRTATDDGVWTEWKALEFHAEEAAAPVPGVDVPQEPDEENPGAHSDPFWVGDASRYELDMGGDEAEEAQVHLVYETARRVAVAETAPAGADPAHPTVWGRGAWGARAPTATPTVAPELKLAIVHHSAGTNNYSWDQVPALLRGIQAYHMDANGWNDIAYNFAVDRFGRVWEARAGGIYSAVVGGHARGFNTGTTGVVVLGNYDQVEPSWPALDAVSQIIAWKFAVHDVDPRYPASFQAGAGSPRYAPGSWLTLNRIISHRDVGLTACPGRFLYAYLDKFRANAAAWYPTNSARGRAIAGNFVGGPETDIYTRQPGVLSDQLGMSTRGNFAINWQFPVSSAATQIVGDFDANGYDDIFWYTPGAGTEYRWMSRGDGRFTSSVAPGNSGRYTPIVGDFDADGDEDIFWYAPGRPAERMWLAHRGNFREVAVPQVGGSWLPVAGDFDADGDDDILWSRHGTTAGVWVSTNAYFVSRPAIPTYGMFVPIAGDFDADGDDDVMWYAPGSAPDFIWTSQNMRFQWQNAPSVPGVYTSVVSGDFDADGGDDLFWYLSPGDDSIWWHTSQMFGRKAWTNTAFR